MMCDCHACHDHRSPRTNLRSGGHHLLVAALGDFVALCTPVGGAAAVAVDDADLLALDVTVVASHPGVDLKHQAAFAQGFHMIRPSLHVGGAGFDPFQIM